MSTWPWIALYAITFVAGTERCELKMLDIRRGNIPAIAMSPGGTVLLAEASQGIYPIAVVFQGERRSTWEIRGLNMPHLVGIDDGGTILGRYLARVQSGGKPRAFLYREGQVRLIPFPQEPELANVGFDPIKIGTGGEVFGSYSGIPDTNEGKLLDYAAALWNGDVQVVGYQDGAGALIGAVARTENGVLGFVPRWLYRNRQGRSAASGHLPVLFTGGAPTGTPFYLRLPSGVEQATPVFTNPSGSLMLALGTASAGSPTTVIWWHDQALVPKMPKNATAPALVSGTHDAKLAVGSMNVKGTRMAAIWEAEKGGRSLEEYAREVGVLLPHGWRLVDAVGISPDGKRVFGNAINRNGLVRPYLLWLGERPRHVSK